MYNKYTLLAFITVFFFAVIAFSFIYGPMNRSFVSVPKVVTADTVEQIAQLWERNGVTGRTAICFTRYLNVQETKESKSMKVIDQSMNHGIVRKVFHILPDAAWPEIHEVLSKWGNMKSTPEGFVGVFDDGRVYIRPFSKLSDIAEKALVIIEPKIWTMDELNQIAGRLKSGTLSSDLLVVVRGSENDAELFRNAMMQAKTRP